MGRCGTYSVGIDWTGDETMKTTEWHLHHSIYWMKTPQTRLLNWTVEERRRRADRMADRQCHPCIYLASWSDDQARRLLWPYMQGCSGAGTRWNAVPANILEPERRSGKYRWPHQVERCNTEAFRQITSYSLGWPSISLFSDPNCPQTRDLASIISKKFPGVTPPDPLSGTHSQHGYTPCAGAQVSPLLGSRSRKPFTQIKICHYTPTA